MTCLNLHSMVYDTIYQSEVIENQSDIRPSLIAKISCPVESDKKIRIYVYYSSNLTSGKGLK